MANLAERKSILRTQLRKQRKTITAQHQHLAAQSLCARVQASTIFSQAKRISSYWPVAGEMDVRALKTSHLGKSKAWFLPRVDGQTMNFLAWQQDNVLQPNQWGIPEPPADAEIATPESLDLILVPLVGADRKLNRLGMGGGFYDRFLARLDGDKKPFLLGVAHDCQLIPGELPVEPWDFTLDALVTDLRWLGESSQTD